MLNGRCKKSPRRGLRVFLLRDETGRLPATCSAAPSATILFGQLSRHVNAVVKVGFSNFVRRTGFFSLSCDLGLCAVNGGCTGSDALGKCTERHHGESSNCNESFDGFHGRIP